MRDRSIRILLGLIILLLSPWPTLVAPSWVLTVVDERGDPIPHLLVRQGWRDRTAMGDQLERSYVTDARGQVDMPPRWAWASTTERLLRLGWMMSSHLVDPARAYAHVYVWEPGYQRSAAVYSRGRPAPARLVAEPADCQTKPVLGRAARLRHFGPSGGESQCMPR